MVPAGEQQPESSAEATPPTEPRPCPTCGAMVEPDAATHPFCSARCRLADLGKWFSGDYVISRRLEERDLDAMD